MSTVYVMEQGAVLKKSGERMIVKIKQKTFMERHFRDIDRLLIFGRIQITTQVMTKLFDYGIDVSYFTLSGFFKGQVLTNQSKNVYLKMAQVHQWTNEPFKLALAKATIQAKLDAQYETITKRRRGIEEDEPWLKEFTEKFRFGPQIKQAEQVESLRGIEGTAARYYFATFDRLLPDEFLFHKRSKRPAQNGFNSGLNFAYTLLLNEINSKLITHGFDTTLGYMHSIRYGRISLSLDVMELFRPSLVDEWMIKLSRLKQLRDDHFYMDQEKGIYLTTNGRKEFLKLYHQWQQESAYQTRIDKAIKQLRRAYMAGDPEAFENYILGK